ncbi:MAG: hypothetical protein HY796_06035 [Elusimicrobia bacterium]|nr:hypothetical protein [Elusimicrobiota bacterium]
MNKKTAISALISLGIIMAVLFVFKISRTSKYNNELNVKMDCTFDNVDLFEITSLSKCDVSSKLAIGVEVNFSFDESQDGKSLRFSLKVSSMSKRDILDEIIRKNPGYNWKEIDGVVSIRPYQAVGAPVSPLDMTISRFEVHQTSPFSALEYLRRLANENNIPVTTPLYEIAVKRGTKVPDSGKLENPGDYDPEQLISVVIPHEVSIRDCLNAIVLAAPPAYWKAIKFKDNKTALFIDSSRPRYSQGKNMKPFAYADITTGFNFVPIKDDQSVPASSTH